MSAMEETTFSVRTDGDNDAMLVPDGIETVVVNESADRVIVPAGVEVIRLQMPKGSGGGRHRSRSRSPDWSTRASSGRSDSPGSYGDMIDELVRAKRSAVSEAVQTTPAAAEPPAARPPPVAEKSLSLPSVPPTPPGSRSAGTDAPDFSPAARPPPLAAAERDIFDDRTLEVDKKRVISQQPAAQADGQRALGNGKVVRYSGDKERELRDPLVAGRSAKMRHHDSFGWREEFERGESDHEKPFIRKLGRATADIICCWMGV